MQARVHGRRLEDASQDERHVYRHRGNGKRPDTQD